jgi:hypothetical protein
MLGEDPQKDKEWKDEVGAHFIATSLADAVPLCAAKPPVSHFIKSKLRSHSPAYGDVVILKRERRCYAEADLASV